MLNPVACRQLGPDCKHRCKACATGQRATRTSNRRFKWGKQLNASRYASTRLARLGSDCIPLCCDIIRQSRRAHTECTIRDPEPGRLREIRALPVVLGPRPRSFPQAQTNAPLVGAGRCRVAECDFTCAAPRQMYVLMMFSSSSCRPLMLGVASPFSSMYFSSEAKLSLPASIRSPMPVPHEP